MKGSRRATVGALLGFAVLAGGCAPMNVGPEVVTETPKPSYTRANPNSHLVGEVTQVETDVTVRTSRLCDVQRIDPVERTSIRRHVNGAPQNEWWAAIGGVLLAGTGTAAVVQPERFRGEDQALSVKEAQGVGCALIGAGALLLAVPVIDYFREQRVAERRVEHVDVPGPIVEQSARCGPPDTGTPIVARASGQPVQIGQTDLHGEARFDLDELVPPATIVSRSARIQIYAGADELGAVPLAPLYERREARAWTRAVATACDTSLDEAACGAHAEYVRSFPDGAHAAEATAALDAARSRRNVAAEEVAWQALEPHACRAPAPRTLAAVTTACAPLGRYLAAFPAGAHADVVKVAWDAGEAIRGSLEVDEARRVAASEARAAAAAPGAFIPYEGNGGGPTLCSDGMWSHSSGRGTCSHHGGVAGGGGSYGGGRSSGGGGRRSSGGHKRR